MILIYGAARRDPRSRRGRAAGGRRAIGPAWGNMRTILLLLAVVSATPGCGQKGDLYLPEDVPEAAAE